MTVRIREQKPVPAPALRGQGLGVGVRGRVYLFHGSGDLGRFVGTAPRRKIEAALAFVCLFVPLLERAGDLPVVASDGLPGGVGNPLGHQLGCGAEQGIALLDVRVEEGQRATGLDGLHP